jgi:plastocyanin
MGASSAGQPGRWYWVGVTHQYQKQGRSTPDHTRSAGHETGSRGRFVPLHLARSPAIIERVQTLMRFARFLSVALLSAAIVAGCSAANAGWTYAPAPSATPVPSGGASPHPSAAASTDPNLVAISALNVAFEQTSVTAPAAKPFKIAFDNKDAGTPHNVAIHDGSGAEVFKGTVFPGVAIQTYDVPALAAGQYTFVCSVHASMTGTLTAQ